MGKELAGSRLTASWIFQVRLTTDPFLSFSDALLLQNKQMKGHITFLVPWELVLCRGSPKAEKYLFLPRQTEAILRSLLDILFYFSQDKSFTIEMKNWKPDHWSRALKVSNLARNLKDK